MLTGLAVMIGQSVEIAETEVTMGHQGLHPERLGERERITVVAFRARRRVAAGGGLTEEPERARLMAALAPLAREDQSPSRILVRVLEPAGQHVRLGQI